MVIFYQQPSNHFIAQIYDTHILITISIRKKLLALFRLHPSGHGWNSIYGKSRRDILHTMESEYKEGIYGQRVNMSRDKTQDIDLIRLLCELNLSILSIPEGGEIDSYSPVSLFHAVWSIISSPRSVVENLYINVESA